MKPLEKALKILTTTQLCNKRTSVSEDVKSKKLQRYGKVKTIGEQGSRVLGVNPSVSRTFEAIKGDRSSKNVDKVNITNIRRGLVIKTLYHLNFMMFIMKNTSHLGNSRYYRQCTTEYNTERYIGRSENVHSYQGK